jgi:putative ABC transport system substrate-binding protein
VNVRQRAGFSRRTFIRGTAGLGAATLLTVCGGQVDHPSASQRIRRIGFLHNGLSAPAADDVRKAFRQRLLELGYVEGTDIVIDFRFTENVIERLPSLAAELVALPVDVLFAPTGPPARAAKEATRKIPIVFVQVTDPIAQGLVTNLARPGGNITGISTNSLGVAAKRVELLKEAVPALTRLAVLWNANMIDMAKLLVPATENAALTLGVATQAQGSHNADETDAFLDLVARQRFEAILVLPNLQVIRGVRHVPDFAERMHLPQIYSDVEIARAGGLMHVGSNYVAQYRRGAEFVDKIFRGASPADLPVEQATAFDFIVNLAAAQRIGLTVPPGVLRQATEVIR